MRLSMLVGSAFSGLLILALPASADAQASPPPASPQAAEIAGCLCLGREMARLRADMAAKHSAYDQLQGELAGTDALLERERATIDVNNPDAVARFRQQLEQCDALFRRSTGPAAAELTGATTRYNASVGQYNTQCANHSWDPVLLSQVQAALSCPAP
jgi:hypothetical protein